MFNPNELIYERALTVEEYAYETGEITGRYTQVETSTLGLTGDGTTVTDATGSEIMTFYNAQSGTFEFTNSIHALDLLASQFGTNKEIASDETKIITPCVEILPISDSHTVTLKYVPVGVTGAEIKYVKVISDRNEFADTYEIGESATDGKFTLDAETKTITLPSTATGKIFVRYDRESSNAVRITKYGDNEPQLKSLLVQAKFHDKCNKNIVYIGYIIMPRAEIDPSNVSITLTPDGKHTASYKLTKDPCAENAMLIDVIIPND